MPLLVMREVNVFAVPATAVVGLMSPAIRSGNGGMTVTVAVSEAGPAPPVQLSV